MLDDLRYIHDHDTADALGSAERQWRQLTAELEIFQDQIEAQNIVFASMGSSATAALIGEAWLDFAVPFQIIRTLHAPSFVSDKTYFIASSYSGNNAEALSALAEAEAKGAHIAVIASGGQLADIARDKNYPLALLPTGLQPRNAVFYGLRALFELVEQAGLLLGDTKREQLDQAGEFLAASVAGWLPTVPTTQNFAKQIALDVIGKSAVMYGGPSLWPAAYRWKTDFNENAKHVAWWSQYPEAAHNEVVGWTEQPITKPYAVIDLRSKFDYEAVQKQFALSEQLLSGRRPSPIIVNAEGDTLITQLLWTSLLGDFVTLYTALASGIDPTPVDLIEKLKTGAGAYNGR